MTGPATGEPDRRLIAPMRTSGTWNAASAILILLALGFALRLIIAYLLPGSGFANDLASFRGWANDLFTNGLYGFYQRPGFHDYTPGYLYYLWALGGLAQVFPTLDLVKIPAILSDLAIGWLIWSMILELGGGRRAALLGAALYLFVPITWFDSVVWGQVDSVGIVFLLLGVRALWRDQPELASVFAVVAAIVKPQLGIIIFVAGAVLLRRYLVDPLVAGGDEPATEGPATEGPARAGPAPDDGPMAGEPAPAAGPARPAWAGTRGPLRLATSGLVGLATAIGLSWPFGLGLPGLIDQVFKTAGGYPYVTVNAYNPWALVEKGGAGLAASGQWLCDAVTGTAANTPCPPGSQLQVAGFPALVAGGLLMAVVLAVILVFVMWRPDRLTILVGLALLALALFVIPTRVHERYLFPFFAVGAILAAVSWRWRVAFATVAAANFLNLYGVLTTPYFKNPMISDWLAIGDFVRSRLGVTAVALLHTGGFVWTALQLRTGAARALSAELAWTANPAPPTQRRDGWIGQASPGLTRGGTDSRPPLPAAWAGAAAWAAPAVAPRSTDDPDPEPGLLSPLTRRLWVRPSRVDRSAALGGEPGGRLDRLDVWILVVVTIAALGLRTWRLAEPYSMHFDEVYHARTATEFLQDWRYGQPHYIYEYTHPHLAKYAMAAGIVAWGDDRVTATSDLGVPVRDAVLESRWDDPTMPDHRAGDRLYVATGVDVRAYDLHSRELLAALPLSDATALAVDPDGHRLFAAAADGQVFELDTSAFDALRTGGDARVIDPPQAFGSFDAPVSRLFATSDGAFLVAIANGDDLVSMDAASGQILGTITLKGAADIAPAGSAEGLVANADNLTDPAAEAKTLADLLGGDQQEIEQRLTSGQGRVVISGTIDAATRPAIESAIADGRLAGLSFESLPGIAVADTQGVSFLSAADMTQTEEVPIAGGATGLALTSNLDAPRLYVAAGRAVTVIKLATAEDSGAPTVETSIPMPAPVSRVTFDPASVLVHVLGTTPVASSEGSSTTIYVIEPHAQAVFADARLPFTPVAWATDVDPELPSGDREAILAFDPAGHVASVDAGQHAFSWRMPGVIAGALTAALLYLLARILFRRRSVGVLVAALSLVDGMLFVQSRIAMNDTYVGLFILAGYVLFAGLWTGIWRRRWAFWVGMPAIGLLMGLALASKWVAAYAIAAMAVLILARSALGRILLILGLIAVTVVLGYQGLTYAAPAAGQTATGSGNVLFIMLMIALTLIATAVTVFHPIAWSLEEVRFAVAAPAAVGVAIGLLAIPLAGRQARVALGPLAASPSTVAVTIAVGLLLLAGGVAVAFSVGGRYGVGPLAPPLEPDDPARLAEPPAPPPTGWLRPGWAFGLPVAWTAGSLLLLPVTLYVVSYIPWALNSGGTAGSPQIFPAGTPIVGNWPPGHTGQTLWDLTKAMYEYHNNLRATHAAASPWWAWPFDLKPVWFYQGSFSGGTAAAIYDAGNLVIWWLGVPAMAFAVWQAFKRRSLALALVTIAFAFQWLSWSRIDRATFQYHYYTSVPFIILALSYFLAELWHGASRRTWLLARVSAAVAIMGPGLLWLFKAPLCAFVGVERAYKDSPACVGNPGDFVLTAQVGLVLLIGVLATVAFAYEFSHLEDRSVFVAWFGRGSALGEVGRRVRFPMTGLILIVGIFIQLAVPADQVLVSIRGFATTPLALAAVVILGFLAYFALTARDARRFVLGTVFAAVTAFIVVYPNIAALPLPSTVFNAYQGLLPTYLYPFQFPVNTDPPPPPMNLFAPDPGLFGLPPGPTLAAVLTVACLVVAYSAWSWRIVLAERRAAAAGALDDDGLARTG